MAAYVTLTQRRNIRAKLDIALWNLQFRGRKKPTPYPEGNHMLLLDELKIQRSEKRQRLNEIAGLSGDAVTEEVKTESDALGKELDGIEVQYRAAIRAQPDPEVRETIVEDSEVRARRELRNKTNLADYLAAAISGRPVTGAALEYAAATSMPEDGVYVPVELFEHGRPIEVRAVTPGVDAATVPDPTVPAIFDGSVAARMGVMFPIAPAGVKSFPVVTTAPPASFVAKDADALDTASAITLVERKPKRVASSFVIRKEDIAVMASLESDLQTAMMGSVADKVDAEVIAGAGGDSLAGLFGIATDVAVAAAVETFNTGLARLAGLVDGKFAQGWSDLRCIVGSTAFGIYAGATANAGKGDISIWDYLSARLGFLTVSNRVPAVSADGQKGLVTRRASGAYAIKVPMWSGIEIVRDPYSNAGKGQIVVTATSLLGDPHVPHGSSQVLEIHPKVS